MQFQQSLSTRPLDSTSSNLFSPLIKASLDQKPFSSRSPMTSAQKRKFSKSKNNYENTDHEQPNPFSGPTFVPMNTARGKFGSTSSTPIKVKEEFPLGDFTGDSKDFNMLAKPFESPFLGLHKDTFMTSSPYHNFASPGWHARLHPNPSYGCFQNMSYDLNPNLLPSANMNRIEFNNPNRLMMFRSHRDEAFLDHDEHMDAAEFHKEYENRSFSLSFWDDASTQPTQMKFPTNKSIYNTVSMIPSQTRTSEIFSQKPTQESNTRKETRSFVPPAEETENIDPNAGELSPRTPSPTANLNKKIKLEAMNSFLSQQQEMDTATVRKAAAFEEQDNSCETSMMRTKFEQGSEDDQHHTGEEFCTLKKKKKVCCNCKKSRCLKLYCDCFNRGEKCSKECNCVNCYNDGSHEKERNEAIMAVLEKNPSAFKPKVNKTDSPERAEKVRHTKGCNCKKSGCQKRYCECYQAGVKCTELCKCEQCKNMDSCCRFKRAQNYSLVNFGSQDSLTMSIPFSDTKMTKQYAKHYRKHMEDSEEGDDSPHYHASRTQMVYSQPDPSYYTDLPVIKRRKLEVSTTDFTPKRTLFFVREENREGEEQYQEENEYTIHIHKKKGLINFKTHAQTDRKKMMKVEETSDSIPSPGAMCARRTKRTIRPFSHFNSDEYELRK